MTKWGKRPADAEQHAHMTMRQNQNLVKSKFSLAETWASESLARTGLRWTRQAQWGWRLYDFWNHELGIAVEVDGPEHNERRDQIRDEDNWVTSRIVVLRVPNFNEESLNWVLKAIASSDTWNQRRVDAGMKPVRGAGDYVSPVEQTTFF